MSDVDSTYGALFIGVLVSAVLFGVTMLQTFVYFSQYPADRVWRKLAVCWLWFLDAIHLALSAHFVYFYLVVNYNNPDALLHIVWSFKIRTIVDGLVVVSVHTLYTFRLWTLLAIDNHIKPFGKEDRRWSDQKTTRSEGASRWLMCKVVPWLVNGLVVINYGIAIVMCFESFRLDTFDRLSHAPWATYIPFCFSTVIDTVIAGSLCYFLARCRTESGAMNGPIRTLMMYTLNTGIISSVCSLLAIAMMVAFPSTFISVAIEFLVIKLYINSYLAMVNARGGLREQQDRRLPSTSYTPNTSIALRDVVRLEHKSIPFPTFPLPTVAIHEEPELEDVEARKSVGLHSGSTHTHDIVRVVDVELELSRTPPEAEAERQSYPLPQLSHPDLCPQYDTVSSHPHPHPPPLPMSLSDRLALTPPPLETESAPQSPTSNQFDFSLSPCSPFPRSSPTATPFPSPLPLPRARSHPHLSASASFQSPRDPDPGRDLVRDRDDYGYEPERTLSPLTFGSPLESGWSGTDSSTESPVDVPRESATSPVDVPRKRERERKREGERYTRMVRTGKERRALFDERGVAVLWGVDEGGS